MMIVEQGKVVDVCAEPGEYTYDISSEPSLFVGDGLADNFVKVFENIGKRFTFGGEAPKDQRVYYFNTKEITGNKYGTPSPVPFRVLDMRAGIDMDISIRCFGEYSYRIVNPLLFYTNVCGNVAEAYERGQLDGQLKTELLTALQPAFARISEMGIRYSSLPGHTTEIANALNEELSAKWRDVRGLEIVAFGVSSVKANEEDEQIIKEMQREVAYTDPGPGGRRAGQSPGGGHESSRFQHQRRPGYGIYGDGNGRTGGRHERPGTVSDGSGEPAGPDGRRPVCQCGAARLHGRRRTDARGRQCRNAGQRRPGIRRRLRIHGTVPAVRPEMLENSALPVVSRAR